MLRRGGGAYALDYIYAWKLERAFAGYELVASEGDARLYAKAR